MKWTLFWKKIKNTGINMAISKARRIKKVVWCRVYQTYQKHFNITYTYSNFLFPNCIVITSPIFRLAKWCTWKQYLNVSVHLLHNIYSFLPVLLTHNLSHSNKFVNNWAYKCVFITWRTWRGKEERCSLRTYWTRINCESEITVSSQKCYEDTSAVAFPEAV